MIDHPYPCGFWNGYLTDHDRDGIYKAYSSFFFQGSFGRGFR